MVVVDLEKELIDEARRAILKQCLDNVVLVAFDVGGLTGESGPPDKGPGQLEAIRLLLTTGKVEQEHLSAARDMAKQMGHQEAMELLA